MTIRDKEMYIYILEPNKQTSEYEDEGVYRDYQHDFEVSLT